MGLDGYVARLAGELTAARGRAPDAPAIAAPVLRGRPVCGGRRAVVPRRADRDGRCVRARCPTAR
ncbi:protein of unknown function (plasmid) [Streptantibioticus cattleyicolor NRRL 8057 = DSM 46488]|nr:protein of unknown function [Streptantibioticus cattleyicolor NRRL 8057 = DSM 46488]